LTTDTIEHTSSLQQAQTTKTVRAFYAIKLNDETRTATRQVIKQLQALDWSQFVRWVPVDNLHITLRFLGDITQSQLEAMNNALIQKLENVRPFSILFKEPRLFPHFRKPKVVAILVPHNETLNQLADLFEQCAIDAGLEPQTRQFKAHLTLGRCNKSFPKRIKIEPMPFSLTLPVNSVSLYQSILSESGPTYIEQKVFPLTNS
jgi:2'-5' RNA ligase